MIVLSQVCKQSQNLMVLSRGEWDLKLQTKALKEFWEEVWKKGNQETQTFLDWVKQSYNQ